MGSLLSASLGFDAITKDDLIKLGFCPYRPVSFVFGEPYIFKHDLVVYKYPNMRHGNNIIGSFQLVVTFPRTYKPVDGNPTAVLTRKLPAGHDYNYVLDNENAIVMTDCDLSILKTMMDENYLRSLI